MVKVSRWVIGVAVLATLAAGTVLVGALLKGGSPAASLDMSAARRALRAPWPAFTAVYREQWFNAEAPADDPHAVTGHEEVRRIRFRSLEDWETVVLSGQTHGGHDPDGSRTEVHAVPGTQDTFRDQIHMHHAPGDGAPTRERSKSLGPNHWLVPWYSDWAWEPLLDAPGAVVRAQHVADGVCPGQTCSGTVVWLNEHGVPVRYEQWNAGVLGFKATVEEFSLAQ
jgi:hypothetical protein